MILCSPSRRAFTLVELLVVITVVAIIASLLLPALSIVRSSARMTLCGANQKQIALAIVNYSERNKHYPASAFLGDGNGSPTTPITGFTPGTAGINTGVFSYVVRLLPLMEQEHIYDALVFSNDLYDPINIGWVDDHVMPFTCPSYRGPRNTSSGPYASLGVSPSIGNYKTYGATSEVALNDITNVRSWRGNGGGIHPYGNTKVLPVTSMTILTVETKEENLAAWADGTTISIWGITEVAVTDDGTESTSLVMLNNLHDTATNIYSSGNWGGYDMIWGPSSEHPGMILHSMGDGGVRRISERVSSGAYHAIITRTAADHKNIGEFFLNESS